MKWKMTLFTLLAAGAIGGHVFAQGTVILQNNNQSLIWNAFTGEPVAAGSVLFQLYSGPQGTPEESLLPQFPVTGVVSFAPGRISDVVVTANNVLPGLIGSFQIRAWNARYPSWEAAVLETSFIGSSIVFITHTGNVGSPPTNPVGLAGLYPGFAVGIPEPSSATLLCFGALALVAFRRWSAKVIRHQQTPATKQISSL